MLDVGVDVRQQLARVIFVGEPVDDRHPRMCREALDDGLFEGADHDHVDHPRDYTRDVLDGLAAAELGIAAVQIDGDSAKLVHARFEGHAGARRRFLEHHGQRAIAQRLIDFVALETLLDPPRAFEQIDELVTAEVLELEKVLGSHGCVHDGCQTCNR